MYLRSMQTRRFQKNIKISRLVWISALFLDSNLNPLRSAKIRTSSGFRHSLRHSLQLSFTIVLVQEKSKHERQQNFFCLKRKFLGVQKRSQNMSVSRIFSVWKENSWVSEKLNRPDFGHLMYICTTYLKNVFYFFSFFSLRFNGSANCASLVTGPSNVSWGQTSTTTQMICLPLALQSR